MANSDSTLELVKPLTKLPDPPPDLVQQLCTQGVIAWGTRFETLYGGRTNQVWKVLGDDGDKVLKLYRSSLRNPLFRNDARLEAHCLQALETTGFVPRLRATGQYLRDHWVFYDHAPGNPWQSGPEEVGALLRKLHTFSVSVAVPDGCNGSADLDAHGQRILGNCASETGDKLARMRPETQIPPTPHRCLIHGDPVAGNILVADSGLTLIDWQCPAVGDPCEDLSLFLSPAMQRLYRGTPLSSKEVQQFLSAYDRPDVVARYHVLRPWFAWRMAAYCLWRVENGAPDYAEGLRLEMETL